MKTPEPPLNGIIGGVRGGVCAFRGGVAFMSGFGAWRMGFRAWHRARGRVTRFDRALPLFFPFPTLYAFDLAVSTDAGENCFVQGGGVTRSARITPPTQEEGIWPALTAHRRPGHSMILNGSKRGNEGGISLCLGGDFSGQFTD